MKNLFLAAVLLFGFGIEAMNGDDIINNNDNVNQSVWLQVEPEQPVEEKVSPDSGKVIRVIHGCFKAEFFEKLKRGEIKLKRPHTPTPETWGSSLITECSATFCSVD